MKGSSQHPKEKDGREERKSYVFLSQALGRWADPAGCHGSSAGRDCTRGWEFWESKAQCLKGNPPSIVVVLSQALTCLIALTDKTKGQLLPRGEFYPTG